MRFSTLIQSMAICCLASATLAADLDRISPSDCEELQLTAEQGQALEAARIAAEKERISLAGGKVSRSGDRTERSPNGSTLRISLANGTVKELTDSGSDCGPDTCRWNEYAAYLPELGFHLIYSTFWEEDGYVLIDASSGLEIKIAGVPSFSPDRSRFVTITTSDMGTRGIEIWRRAPSGFIKEWERETHGYYCLVAWHGETKLQLRRYRMDTGWAQPDSAEAVQVGEGNWQIDPPDRPYF